MMTKEQILSIIDKRSTPLLERMKNQTEYV